MAVVQAFNQWWKMSIGRAAFAILNFNYLILKKSLIMKKYTLFFVILFQFFVSQHGLAQLAVCKEALSFSTLQSSCGELTILPSELDNGSSDYDTLYLSQNVLPTLGTYTITLTAAKFNGSSSSCTSIVSLEDHTAPFMIVKQSVTIALDEDNLVLLTPQMFDNGSYDHCSSIELAINEKYINCYTGSPLTVRLRATDEAGNYNESLSQVTITQNQNISTNLVCLALVEIELPAFYEQEVTSDILLKEGGPYACYSYYNVTVSENNIKRPRPFVNSADEGKTLQYKVVDPKTGNACWGNVKVTVVPCNYNLDVCDTKSRCEPLGECNTGHSLLDVVEWPCDITINNAPQMLLTNPSIYKIADHINMSYGEAKPSISIDQCATIGESIIYTVVKKSPILTILEVKYSYLNWDKQSQTASYTQKIFFNNIQEDNCTICDTLPWSAPISNCDGGHTLNDAVEWPADITVNTSLVSPYDLSINPLVNINNAKPALSNCASLSLSYSDQLVVTNPNNYYILRTWTLMNWESLQTRTYKQKITILIAPPSESRTVCVETYYGQVIGNVQLYGGNILSNDLCKTFVYDPVKTVVTPKKDKSSNNGLDVTDIFKINEYIFKIDTLSKLGLIVADFNQDGVVTTSDVNTISKIFQGDTIGSKLNDRWIFYDQNVYLIQKKIVKAKNIFSPYTSHRFVGLEKGDLDQFRLTNLETEFLSLEDAVINKDESYELKFKTKVDHRIKAIQIQLAKNDSYEITSIKSTLLPNINFYDKEDHYLIVWSDSKISDIGQAMPIGSELFTLKIKSKVNDVLNKVIKFGDPKASKLVEQRSDPILLDLSWKNAIISSTIEQLNQSILLYPNPTTNLINIQSEIPIASYIVRDISGKTALASINDNNTIDVSNLKSGLYLLSLKSNMGYDIVKKIIVAK